MDLNKTNNNNKQKNKKQKNKSNNKENKSEENIIESVENKAGSETDKEEKEKPKKTIKTIKTEKSEPAEEKPKKSYKRNSSQAFPEDEKTSGISKKFILSNTQRIKDAYNKMVDSKTNFLPLNQKVDESFFGEERRYSKRIRVSRLNHLAGENIKYKLIKDPVLGISLPTIVGFSKSDQIIPIVNTKEIEKKPKKKKLIKGLAKIQEEDEDEKNEEIEDIDLPEDYEEEECNEEEEFIIVPPKSQKGESLNMQVYLHCEVINSAGKNKIVISNKVLMNLKPNSKFCIMPLNNFNFLNYSDMPLKVKIRISDTN